MVFRLTSTQAKQHKGEVVVSPLVLTIEASRIAFVGEDSAYVNFQAHLKIHFLNHGPRPFLMFNGRSYPLNVSVRLARSRDEAIEHRYVFISSVTPSPDRPAWLGVVKDLDRVAPPDDLIRAIAAGSSWDLERDVVPAIEKKGSFDKASLPWSKIREVNPVWLQVQFMVWPNNLEHDPAKPKFGIKLRKRWKDNGELAIDDVMSEPIPIDLAGSFKQPQH